MTGATMHDLHSSSPMGTGASGYSALDAAGARRAQETRRFARELIEACADPLWLPDLLGLTPSRRSSKVPTLHPACSECGQLTERRSFGSHAMIRICCVTMGQRYICALLRSPIGFAA